MAESRLRPNVEHLVAERKQFPGPWAAGCRCRPSGEFLVADLRVLVSMATTRPSACHRSARLSTCLGLRLTAAMCR